MRHTVRRLLATVAIAGALFGAACSTPADTGPDNTAPTTSATARNAHATARADLEKAGFRFKSFDRAQLTVVLKLAQCPDINVPGRVQFDGQDDPGVRIAGHRFTNPPTADQVNQYNLCAKPSPPANPTAADVKWQLQKQEFTHIGAVTVNGQRGTAEIWMAKCTPPQYVKFAYEWTDDGEIVLTSAHEERFSGPAFDEQWAQRLCS